MCGLEDDAVHGHDEEQLKTRPTDYERLYFDEYSGSPYYVEAGWMTMFRDVARHLVHLVDPCRSVLDAGCAKGFLVEALAELGVDAEGVDISEHAVATASSAVQPRLRVASLTDPLPRHYDLITCIEVLEHLAPAEAEIALDNLCRATDHIFFSSTPSDFSEPTHVNIRTPGEWATAFARRGFFRRFDADTGFLTWHSVLFVRRPDPSSAELVFAYEEKQSALRQEVFEKRQALLEGRRELDELRAAASAEGDVAQAGDDRGQKAASAVVDQESPSATLETHYQAAVVERDALRLEITELQAQLRENQAVRRTLEEHREVLQRYVSEFADQQATLRTKLEDELSRTRAALDDAKSAALVRSRWRHRAR